MDHDGLFASALADSPVALAPVRPDPAPPLHPARPAGRPAALPALRFCVLGSGSGGNCSLLHAGDAAVLLDLGFGPRTVHQRLAQTGVALQDVRGVLLTHLDQDHFRPGWTGALLRLAIPLHVHRWHVDDFLRLDGAADLQAAGLVRAFGDEPFEPSGAGLRVHPLLLPHDRKGTVGFRFDTPLARLGYATDLGHVPAALIEHFTADGGVDLLAIESNYDPHLQRTSTRPAFLKQRIMGGHGHLSNEQAFDAVRRLVALCRAGRPQRIVLLHRSAQCNGPEIVRRVFAQDPAIARRAVLTQQRRRSPWFEVRPVRAVAAAQLHLGF